MSKVFGIHRVTLRPGISGKQFEKFYHDKMASGTMYPGWKVHLLKADRGEHEGEYAVLFEMDSVQARDRYSPSPNKFSKEAEQFNQAHPEMVTLLEEWGKLASTPGDNDIYTDYVTVE